MDGDKVELSSEDLSTPTLFSRLHFGKSPALFSTLPLVVVVEGLVNVDRS